MISRKKLEKTVSNLNMHNFINVKSLEEFISFDSLNSYDGRVKQVLKLYMNKREYLMFKFLCNELFKETFIKRYSDRIEVCIIPLSSSSEQHYIKIDGRKFYLVGNDEQFSSQFKEPIRQEKIDDLLEEEE